jgi:AraC-like DNA-binding protein
MTPLTEITVLIDRHVGPGDMTTVTTAIPTLAVSRCRRSTEPLGHVYEPILALVAQGTKQTVLGNRTFNYRAGQYLIVSASLPITSRIVTASFDKPFLALSLKIKPTLVADLILEIPGTGHSKSELTAMGTSNAPSNLLDPLMRLLRLLDHPRDVAVLATGIEREIIWRLINGPKGALIRTIGTADPRLSEISHTLQWIHSHLHETLRVETLAANAKMSLSTFHRHFKSATAMTPIQYQKQSRLQEAHRRLLSNEQSIEAVGFSVGYESPSQFSREYKRFFGLPPSQDVRLRRQRIFSHSVGA